MTRDEERNLPRALASLPRGIAVLVLDAQSCDRTVEFARGSGARAIVRPWSGFVDTRTYAQREVTTPWTLVLDADEALDDVLREAIVGASGARDGYTVARDTYFCGRPLRMWRGERLLRLFRTSAARVEAHAAAGGDAAIHETYAVDGSVDALPGTLLHFSYPDVASYREKYARYTTLEAAALHANAGTVVVAALRGIARFAWLLVRRGAVLDGWRGIYVAWRSAFYTAVVAGKAMRTR